MDLVFCIFVESLHFCSFVLKLTIILVTFCYVSFQFLIVYFLGGLAETPLHGGLEGPTFACIIGIQFRNLRKCDRFWYEGGNPLTRFTESQLAEIRKVTLSKLMCENCDQVSSVQRGMFDIPDPFLNPRVPCDALPGINLDFWKERISCSVQDINIGTS